MKTKFKLGQDILGNFRRLPVAAIADTKFFLKSHGVDKWTKRLS